MRYVAVGFLFHARLSALNKDRGGAVLKDAWIDSVY